MCIAAAIVGGALIGAAGTAIAGSEAASATKSAAATASADTRAALAQQEALAAPYTELGKSAIPTYESLLGIGKPGGPSPQETLSNLPGYQFTKQQGIESTQATAAAAGLGRSGNLLKGIADYTTGLADQTYNEELQNLLAPIQIGQGAAAGQAANIGAAGTRLGDIAIGRGNALAGIDANTIAGITNAIGRGVDTGVTQNTLKNLNPNYGAPAGWFTGGQTGNLTYSEQVAAGF